MGMRPRTMLGTATVAGAAVLGYAAVVERNWFALRRYEVPVLPVGSRPLRILHISDVHLTPAGTACCRSFVPWTPPSPI